MGYRINVRNCKRAAVSVNTSSSYTLATPVAMPGLREIDLALTSATGELYGDGELVSKRSKLTGATLKFGLDKLTQADRAALEGHTVTNKGVMQIKTTDTPAETAIYFEMELDNGGYEAVWLLCGKVDPISFTAQQAEGNITYSTDEITMNFVRREKDKELLAYADTDNVAFDTAAQTAFATSPDITT